MSVIPPDPLSKMILPLYMLPTTSFAGVQTTNLDALQGTKPKAMLADVAGISPIAVVSDITDGAPGMQVLEYQIEFDNTNWPTTLASGEKLAFSVGKLPKNALLVSWTSYAGGLFDNNTGLYGFNVTDLAMIMKISPTANTDTGLAITRGGTGTGLEPLDTYPDWGRGQFNFNPSGAGATYGPIPFIHLGNGQDNYLTLVFGNNTSGPAVNVGPIRGTLTVRCTVLQMNPNNTAANDYPAGGVPVGLPVPFRDIDWPMP